MFMYRSSMLDVNEVSVVRKKDDTRNPFSLSSPSP
jgi:hypothetical protein